MEIYTARIDRVITENQWIKSYFLKAPAGLNWEEGAHTHVALKGFNDGEKPNKELVRHMSIMTLPSEGKLGFTTRLNSSASLFKTKLAQATVGDELHLFKIGSKMNLKRQNRPLIFISMGVAMATMRPLILKYSQQQENIPKVYNLTIHPALTLYKQEIESRNISNFSNEYVTDRKKLYDEINRLNDTEGIYYLSGSDTFLGDIIARLFSLGVKADDIVLDKKGEERTTLLYRYEEI